MGFYDLNKTQRLETVNKISETIAVGIKKSQATNFLDCFSNEDTYIRKTAYLAFGRVYEKNF